MSESKDKAELEAALAKEMPEITQTRGWWLGVALAAFTFGAVVGHFAK